MWVDDTLNNKTNTIVLVGWVTFWWPIWFPGMYIIEWLDFISPAPPPLISFPVTRRVALKIYDFLPHKAKKQYIIGLNSVKSNITVWDYQKISSFFSFWFFSPAPNPLVLSPPTGGEEGGHTQLYTRLMISEKMNASLHDFVFLSKSSARANLIWIASGRNT